MSKLYVGHVNVDDLAEDMRELQKQGKGNYTIVVHDTGSLNYEDYYCVDDMLKQVDFFNAE